MIADRHEILRYLAGGDDEELFARARAVRQEQYGHTVYLRGLLEFSSYCRRQCRYCGLRAGNTRAARFRLRPAEVLDTARTILASGIRTVVLQSGEDIHYTTDDLCRIIRGIKTFDPGAAVTLSVGKRPDDEYRTFRAAGADRFLMRHEAADPDLYRALHPDGSWGKRMEKLFILQSLGYQVGAGMMTGLPGQTLEHLAADILFLQTLQPAMTGIGPFIPHRDTPLGHDPAGDVETILRVLALVRLAVPDTLLPATTALATLDPEHGLRKGLEAGCNVIMVDYTPDARREEYNLYDDKARVTRDAAGSAAAACGLTLSGERGDCVRVDMAAI